MNLLIREAIAADDEAIGELLVDAFVVAYGKKLPGTHTVSERRKADLRDVKTKREGGRVLVAEHEGRVVGTVTLYPPGAEHSRAWLPDAVDLRYLATASELHGRGLSRQLLDAAEGWCRSIGAKRVCLNVRQGVDGLVRLYQARGYVRDARGDRFEAGDVRVDGYALEL